MLSAYLPSSAFAIYFQVKEVEKTAKYIDIHYNELIPSVHEKMPLMKKFQMPYYDSVGLLNIQYSDSIYELVVGTYPHCYARQGK